jgi:glycosyltransferase involved in cell wall biosynthesis
LERFLKSVQLQTFKNYELIVVDGASNDRTRDIIKKNENGVITTWISEKDSGVYDAWNKGLKLAKGQWITFIGSDDILYPDAFQSYVDFLNEDENKDLNFLSSKIEIINSKNIVVRELGWAWEWDKFKKMCNIAHPGALHHKSLFDVYGEFNTTYRICGDYDFLLRVGENLKAGYMHKITLQMALGGLSDTKGLMKEVYRAIGQTGQVPKIEMYQQYLLQHVKFYVKRILRIFDIYIVLKK